MKLFCNIARNAMTAGIVLLLMACDQGGSGGHMMGGGMMGGGMMRSTVPRDNAQPLPEAQSRGAVLVRDFCGQCHAPPRPAVHTAAEWPPVATRMRQYMVTQGKAVPDRQQLEEIITYLQRHAG